MISEESTKGPTIAAGPARTVTPKFLEKPAPIPDIREIKDYDVVVIGAGSPG